jgi:hypothetical protein
MEVFWDLPSSRNNNQDYSMKILIASLAFAAAGFIFFAAGFFHFGGSPHIPRTQDGHPDLNGTWQVLNSANFDLESHSARAAMALRSGPVIPVPAREVIALGAVGAVPAGLSVVEGGEIPYRPEALEKKKYNQSHWLELDPEIKCFLPGVPRANYLPHPFQIVQSSSAILFVYEFAGAVRNIFLKDPGPARADSWMGQSVGRWEGDSLIIDVTDQNDKTWLARAGDFHSAQLRVRERFTLVDSGRIDYDAELTDPETFTRPWKIHMNLYRRIGDDAQLLQFKCVEFVEELMYGHLRSRPLK